MIIPELPPASGYESTGRARLWPRYEDITQDGRVHLASLMTGLASVWRTFAEALHMRAMHERGIVPILSRIIMTGGDAVPFSPHVPIEVEGTWRLAHEASGERIFLDMWLEAYAPSARPFEPEPAADAPRSCVGRVYAEHVVTRPFASTPAERKVARLDVPGLPEVPEHAHAHEAAAALVAGRELEPVAEHVFAMMHTDSNQHVNSLVYPRLFEEAAMTAAIARGERPTLLARAIELRYRKPFFAGERAVVALAMAPSGRGLDVFGTFAPRGANAPSTALAVALR